MALELAGATQGIVYLVGAGPGDPGLITVRGLERLRQADVVIYDRLLDEQLLVEAPPRAELIYAGKQADHHPLPQPEISALIVSKAREGKRVVRLKGGDPFVFGRGGEEAEALAETGIPFEVVPGITSAFAVPAYAGIAVAHKDCTSSIAVVTGHEALAKRGPEIAWEKLAGGESTLVLMMAMKNLPHVVNQLLGHGLSPQTPIALVRCGTRPSQETLMGTLADIVCLADGRGFGPPAVAVVGEVVRLRDRLRWFDNRPLFGRRVLVTLADEQASALSRPLVEAGAHPVQVPAISIDPPTSWEEMDRAIAELDRYAWVIFASANAVHSFFRRLHACGHDARALSKASVAAIGPGTAGALGKVGIRADFVPIARVAETVAAGLAERGIGGARVLFPRAAGTYEALVARLHSNGAEVDEVTAYRIVPPTHSSHRLQEILDKGDLDAAAFASSSSVRNTLAMLGDRAAERLASFTIACIGPMTASTARHLGLRVDVVAPEHTMLGLVRALEKYYSSRGG